MEGPLKQNESPKIVIELSGKLSTNPQSFEAIVDTGFTGSISIPLANALPLGLVLFSMASFTLADGSREDTFLCLGTAQIAHRKETVIISLSKGKDVLIGTEFLLTFGATLVLDYKARKFNFTV